MMFDKIEKDAKWQVKEMSMIVVRCFELDFMKPHICIYFASRVYHLPFHFIIIIITPSLFIAL